MQGFNRYIPPDYDPREHSTLNAAAGKKHALGKRARHADQGVLTVRFEMPFNVWCDGCKNHIGAGVRYNAQKRRTGSYYSTPIFAFLCKCHLCGGAFEIATDPQNAAYVVNFGLTRKAEEWDGAAAGGWGAFDTDDLGRDRGGLDEQAGVRAAAGGDAFAALERGEGQRAAHVSASARVAELGAASARLAADPYAVNARLRKRLRADKADLLAGQDADDATRARFGLSDDVHLPPARPQDAEAYRDALRAQAPGWAREEGGRHALARRVQTNTARRMDAFETHTPRIRLRRARTPPPPPPEQEQENAKKPGAGLGGLAAYGSDSESGSGSE